MGQTFCQTCVELQLNSPQSKSEEKHHSHSQKTSTTDHLVSPGGDKCVDVKRVGEQFEMFKCKDKNKEN